MNLNPDHLITEKTMFLAVPYHSFDVSHIHMSSFQPDKYGKTIARLMYKDPSIDFHDVSMLSPPVHVVQYDPYHSRLTVELADHPTFLMKYMTLYDNLMSTLYIHQQNFLQTTTLTMDDIRRLFYSTLEGTQLSLYVFPTATVQLEKGGTCSVQALTEGDTIRFAVRIQGVSQLMTRDGLRLRLHHMVPVIAKLDS